MWILSTKTLCVRTCEGVHHRLRGCTRIGFGPFCQPTPRSAASTGLWDFHLYIHTQPWFIWRASKAEASDHEATITSGLERIRVSSTGPDRIRVSSSNGSGVADDGTAEVSIRIIGADEMDQIGVSEGASTSSVLSLPASPSDEGTNNPLMPTNPPEGTDVTASGNQNSQRYDFQQFARWVEQVLPFSLLLLTVFIRQHLQGFLVTFWLSLVLVKSNDVLRKQTALKGERKSSILLCVAAGLFSQIGSVYWLYRRDDLHRPLFMLPPLEIPKFWHAVFIILVNDMMVRQGAMVLKAGILMYYKNTRGRNYRRQGQLLTFVEYVLLLYRALLPTPVWYRFFLNKDYGSFFSSLTTGLYLTFKLTSVLEKVHLFIASLKALLRREVQYGSYATAEEVNAAGDLCAICQEKMHAPILLSCKHLFCEDCVSEWFERERTCPLCRAVVKPAELKSFADGSTSLFYQMF
ncbi:hypothetical protein GOP47_0002571 [Adiantum capillus-veneris]|uniref:RING-type domain-containing protein n=1 Tax=Adiantum capillus-veneris TaxID=13818 RepID=A0A9D4VAU6_ADICA|nr:hypothetical protein GOP47_0002571 [Adiantum capillus-veneris]